MQEVISTEKECTLFPLLQLPPSVLINVLYLLDDYSKCSVAQSCSLLFGLACDYAIWPNATISDSVISSSRQCLSKALCLPPQIFKVEVEYGRSKRFPVCVPLLNLRSILHEPDATDLATRASLAVQELLVRKRPRSQQNQLIQIARADRGCVRLGFNNNAVVQTVICSNEGFGWSPAGMSWLKFQRFEASSMISEFASDYQKKLFSTLPDIESDTFSDEQHLKSQDRLALFYGILFQYYQKVDRYDYIVRDSDGKGVVSLQAQWFARTSLAQSSIELIGMAMYELETRIIDNSFAMEIAHNVVRLMLHHPALTRITQEQQSQRTMHRILSSTVDIFVCYYQLLYVAKTVLEPSCESPDQAPAFVQKKCGLRLAGLDLQWTEGVIKRAGLNEAELALCLRRLPEIVEHSRELNGSTTELFNFATDIAQAVVEYSKGGKADSLGLGSCSVTTEATKVRMIYDQMKGCVVDVEEELDGDLLQLLLRFRLQMEALRILDWCLVLLGAL